MSLKMERRKTGIMHLGVPYHGYLEDEWNVLSRLNQTNGIVKFIKLNLKS
jgi:hypothetical protein